MTYLPRVAARLGGGVPEAGQQLEQALMAVGFQKLVIFLQREPFLSLEIFCFRLGREYCTQQHIFE